jgi:putative hydrolase of the HAD superfamily
MIKAIIFDWGGVLIDNPSDELIAYCTEHLKVTKYRFREAHRKFLADFQKGKISEDEWWKKVCFELGVPKPKIQSLWGDAVRCVFSEKKEVFALIHSLRRNGYKIGFLSNTEIPAMDFFHEQGYKVFDAVIFSCEEGTRKPKRRIYEIALEKLGLKPEEAVFVDDKKENIEGAEKVGIKTVLFENPDQLKEKLLSFSVKID